MLNAGFARDAVGSVVAALTGIAHELLELRRSVDHHAIVTSRPELHSQAQSFYLESHALVHH